MELPESYANFMQFVPEKVRPMVQAANQMQSDKMMALQQQLAQEKAALDEQRIVKHSQIDQSIAGIPDEIKQFPAFQYDVNREKALTDLNHARRSVALSVYGQSPDAAERQMKLMEQQLSPLVEASKPFQDTTSYKDAEKNWTGLKDINKRISLVTGAATKAQELINQDEGAALRHMKTNLIKPLNSILSNDAIQLSEMLIRYNDLLNAPETAALGNKSAFNPTTWFNKYSQAEDSAEKGSMLDDLTSKAFNANPKRFLETAVNGINGYIGSYNDQLQQQVINPTSPGVAKQMGAVLMPQLEHKQQQDQLPAVFPQSSIPYQGQPVQGGSTQMPSPQQLPVQASPFGAPPPGAVRIKQR